METDIRAGLAAGFQPCGTTPGALQKLSDAIAGALSAAREARAASSWHPVVNAGD